MKIEIDDSIRTSPELLESVQQANSFLSELAGASSPHLRVEWRLSPHDPQQVELGLAEDRDYHARISPSFPVRNLLDPVNRKLRLLRAWDFILQARSKQNLERIRETLHHLEMEAADAQDDAH